MTRNAGALLAAMLFSFAALASAQTAWETYLDEPATDNARLVQIAEYSTHAQQPLEHCVESDLRLVEYLVSAGDVAALQLTLRLSHQFERSASLSEYLHDIIGSIVRSNAKAYLESAIAVKMSCPGIASLPEAFVDRPRAQRLELRARLNALSHVLDSELVSARDQCMKRLREAIGNHDV